MADSARDSKGHFLKGQSGNPSGRPKAIAHLQLAAREKTQEAIDCLVEIMTNSRAPAHARVSAASEILARGWGRPMQSLEISQTHRPHRLEDMSDTELLEFIERHGGSGPVIDEFRLTIEGKEAVNG